LVTGFDGNFRKDGRGKTNNRELNREFFEFALKSIEFCPKSANFAFEQGINREFCGYLSEPRINPERFRFYGGIQKINREPEGNFTIRRDPFGRGSGKSPRVAVRGVLPDELGYSFQHELE
jgi:hypothetical protein